MQLAQNQYSKSIYEILLKYALDTYKVFILTESDTFQVYRSSVKSIILL